jgi:putative ABC transport system permease protein
MANGVWQDVRIGLRLLAKHRQFTLVSVLILAAGAGATTAVFSVVNAVLLRPLPYGEPSQLAAIVSVYKAAEVSRRPVVRLTDVAEWRTRSRAFASMGAFAYTQLPVRAGDHALSPVTALMDPEFLPTLGLPLRMGTFFEPGAPNLGDMTVIVSHALWMEAFGGDSSVVGQRVIVDGAPFTVRGVLAEGFQFPRSDASYFTAPVDLLVPSSAFAGFPPQARQWFAIGRLAPGVGLAAAESELQGIAEGLWREQSPSGPVWSVQLASLADETTRRARQPLMVVLGISIVLLLIAATNLMNLFFSRGTVRLKEMAIRRAIGGSTVQLIRQVIVETLLLAAAGGGLGVWFAWLAIDAIVALSPVHLPVTGGISIDRRVLAFTVVVCGGAALAAALWPAIRLGRMADETVRSPGMRVSAGRAVTRVQHGLCVLQIALGVALLAVAGLLLHSLWRLNAVPPGFNPREVLGFNMSVPNDLSLEARRRFYAQALDEIRTIPGVRSAGLISFLPPETRAGVFMPVAIAGAPPLEPNAPPRMANTLITSVDYFRTVETAVVRGRDFSDDDSTSSPPVVIVNEAFARRHFPDRDALGGRIGTGFDGLKPVREIVGIVADTHDRGLATEAIPTAYLPFQQFALPYGSVAVRTGTAPAAIVPVIRDRLTRLNPAVPLGGFQRLEDRLHESLREPRFYTLMALTCALMAVFFVSFGLYGLVSYSVSRRTSELGIRMAMGANRVVILGLVLRQGLRMSLAGVGLGLLLAIAGTRALRSLLFEVQPTDPLTLAAASALVVIVTLTACYAPARRASRVSPLTALRQE